ncbi:MAG: glycosyltransferase [Bacteroidetes bacterium]|nr:glycosyltransferase [Bacteroidota bacterium]
MKILWLCSWFPNELDHYGGDFIERHAKALALHNPVDVIHIVQNQDLSKKRISINKYDIQPGLSVMVHTVPVAAFNIQLLNQLTFNFRYLIYLKRLLRQYIAEHGKPDMVHVHVPVKIGAGALYLKKKFNVPFVVTEHSSAYFSHIPFNYHSLNPFYKWMARQTFQQALAVSSVSEWLLSRLDDIFKPARLKLIRNSVDTSLFYHTPSTNAVKRFIHVSMMEPLKNVKGIIEAFIDLNRLHTDWELVLVGPPYESYQKMAQEGGVGHKVIFTGLLRYDEVAAQMRTADALVHFSRYENLPCVITEALCCGLFVIASDVGGIREVIHSENGILVQSEDIKSLRDSLANYLDNSSAYDRKKISDEAASVYNYHAIGLQILHWYQALLK